MSSFSPWGHTGLDSINTAPQACLQGLEMSASEKAAKLIKIQLRASFQKTGVAIATAIISMLKPVS